MITQSRLKELLSYCPTTGIFTWNEREGERSFNTQHGGKEAGTIKPSEKSDRLCRRIPVDGKPYYAHRLAWLYVHGKFPDNEIDHINGNALDNGIGNLRDVTRVENCRNTPIRNTNTNGIFGVNFQSREGKYKVVIGDNHPTRKGRKFIGHYADFFEACCARKSAELKYDYHPNHGRA